MDSDTYDGLSLGTNRPKANLAVLKRKPTVSDADLLTGKFSYVPILMKRLTPNRTIRPKNRPAALVSGTEINKNDQALGVSLGFGAYLDKVFSCK